jgi:hypothetical protein
MAAKLHPIEGQSTYTKKTGLAKGAPTSSKFSEILLKYTEHISVL